MTVCSIVRARDRGILDPPKSYGVYAAVLVLRSTDSYLEVDVAASLFQQVCTLLEAQCRSLGLFRSKIQVFIEAPIYHQPLIVLM